MNIIHIAFYTMKRNLRDIRMMLLLIVLPIFLIVILGTALDQFITPQNIKMIEVCYLNEDSGDIGGKFDDYLMSDEIDEILDVNIVETYEIGITKVKKGIAEAFIYIDHSFTSSIKKGHKNKIHVYSNNDRSIVKSLVESFTHSANSASAMLRIGGKIEEPNQVNIINPMKITTNGKAPRAIDYYAVQTLLQVFLLGAMFGVVSIQEDKIKNTYIRLVSSPLKDFENLIGKTIANIVVLFSQAILVLLFTKYVYHANWSGNMLLTLLTILIFVIITIGIGILLGALLKNEISAILVIFGMLMFFATIAGAFSPHFLETGSTLSYLRYLSPNYYAKTIIFNNIYGGSIEEIQKSLICLISVTVMLYTLIFGIVRRKMNDDICQ